METKQIPAVTEYKGFEITELFSYAPTSKNWGLSDFQVWQKDSDFVTMYPYTTLSDIHADIDEKLSEA